MSKNFERWKELAVVISKEQDPVKLTELASEMNLALKTPYLDPPLREIPQSWEGCRTVNSAHSGAA
jgi:hypothetical protein